MSRDLEQHRALVALAGWIWIRIRRGDGTFRRADLDGFENLQRFAGDSPGARKNLVEALKLLREYGIEAEFDPAEDAYRIEGILLSDAEQQALANVALSVAYRDLDVAAARRIPGAFLEEGGDVVLMDSSQWLEPIAEAIAQRSTMTMDYGGGTRVIQPIALGMAKGAWYVVAHDGEAAKNFKLERITDLGSADQAWDESLHDVEAAQRSIDALSDPFMWGDGPVHEVVVSVDEAAALRAARLLRVPIPESAEGGRVEVRRPVRDLDNFVGAVLGLEEHAEVLEPPEARAAVVEWLEAMVAP